MQSTSLNGSHQPTQPTPMVPQPTLAQEKLNSSSSSLVVGARNSSREVERRQRSGSWRGTSRKGSPGSTPSRYHLNSCLNYLSHILNAGSRKGEGGAEHRGGEGPGDQDGGGGQHPRDGQVQPPCRGGEYGSLLLSNPCSMKIQKHSCLCVIF